MIEDEDQEMHEWTRTQYHLPEDDFDEDDEIDNRIAEVEERKRNRVSRGNRLSGID